MMYNILDHEDDLSEYDLFDAKHIGFDQHNEPEHLSYGEYLMSLPHQNWGKMEAVVNSHHSTLGRYRAMLNVFDQELEAHRNLTLEGARRVPDAGHCPKKSDNDVPN